MGSPQNSLFCGVKGEISNIACWLKNKFTLLLVELQKVIIIASGFMILKAFNVFPAKLVNTLQIAMTTTQAITALIGVIVASGIYGLEKKSIKDKAKI